MAGSPTDTPAGPTCLGFLTILQEANGYLGGYLVTNNWGRPLEFRLSSAVQPNRVQQILYGGTLLPYVFADLIGKTLVEKAGVAVQWVVTDREPVLELRRKIDAPVLLLADGSAAAGPELVAPATAGRGALVCHPEFAAVDVPVGRELLSQLDGAFDLAEPFARIREAVGEARKLGVGGRAA